jgi:uncharacterized protein with PIN domain
VSPRNFQMALVYLGGEMCRKLRVITYETKENSEKSDNKMTISHSIIIRSLHEVYELPVRVFLLETTE